MKLPPNHIDYRALAFEHYPPFCAYCGFGIAGVLEVAHIDGQRQNCGVDNLVILCPTCHRMLDVDLIDTPTMIHIRDRMKSGHADLVNWKKLQKDAGAKAGATRSRQRAARKAVATRRSRALAAAAVALPDPLISLPSGPQVGLVPSLTPDTSVS